MCFVMLLFSGAIVLQRKKSSAKDVQRYVLISFNLQSLPSYIPCSMVCAAFATKNYEWPICLGLGVTVSMTPGSDACHISPIAILFVDCRYFEEVVKISEYSILRQDSTVSSQTFPLDREIR